MFFFSCIDHFEEFSFDNKNFIAILWLFPAGNGDLLSSL